MESPPKQPDKFEGSDSDSIRLSNKAAKSLKTLKVSQPHGRGKVQKVIEAIAEWKGFPPNIDITKMKGSLHGHDVYAATVRGKPEYRVIFQAYDDHVMVEDVMTMQQFLSRYSKGI